MKEFKYRSVYALIVGVLFLGNANADMIYYYGSVDNSTALGISPSHSVSIAWQDAFVMEGETSNNGSSQWVSARQDGTFNDSLFGLWSFGELADIDASSDIDYAKIHLYVDSGSGADSLSVMGIAAGNHWTENGVNWSTVDGSNNWSGGNFGDSLTTDYATINYNEEQGMWIEVDITAAVKDYVDGNNSGIALRFDSNAGLGLAATLNIASDEHIVLERRGGLEIGVIPEPTVMSLIGVSGMVLLVGRRLRNPNESTTLSSIQN